MGDMPIGTSAPLLGGGQRHLRTTPMARPRRKPGHEGERRAAHTVNGYCRVLRAFAGWLAEAGYVDAHPLGTFRPGRLPTREVEPIAADDQQRLLDACDPRSPLGLRDLAILSVLLDTGLRSSKLCRLLVAGLDLASGEVRVRGGKAPATKRWRLASARGRWCIGTCNSRARGRTTRTRTRIGCF